jgi:hypothetical protein
MIRDRELETWREQWGSFAEPLPETRQIRRKIKRQELRFILDNLLAAIALLAGLACAAFVRQQQSWLGTGWAAGICVLVFVGAACRIWFQRGTWRSEAQSTRAFLELWKRRVKAKIRALRVASYLAASWLVFCAVLGAVNWPTIGRDFKGHPADWLEGVIASVFGVPLIFFWMVWRRRRTLAELNEVEKILDETKD